jgi:hypothetical protein
LQARDRLSLQTTQIVVDLFAIKRFGYHATKVHRSELVIGSALTRANLLDLMTNSATPQLRESLTHGLERVSQLPKVVFCRQVYGSAYVVPLFELRSTTKKYYSMLLPTSCLDLPYGAAAQPASSLYAVDSEAPDGYIDLSTLSQPSIFGYNFDAMAPAEPAGSVMDMGEN